MENAGVFGGGTVEHTRCRGNRGSSWGVSEEELTGRRVGAGALVQNPGAD